MRKVGGCILEWLYAEEENVGTCLLCWGRGGGAALCPVRNVYWEESSCVRAWIGLKGSNSAALISETEFTNSKLWTFDLHNMRLTSNINGSDVYAEFIWFDSCTPGLEVVQVTVQDFQWKEPLTGLLQTIQFVGI